MNCSFSWFEYGPQVTSWFVHCFIYKALCWTCECHQLNAWTLGWCFLGHRPSLQLVPEEQLGHGLGVKHPFHQVFAFEMCNTKPCFICRVVILWYHCCCVHVTFQVQIFLVVVFRQLEEFRRLNFLARLLSSSQWEANLYDAIVQATLLVGSQIGMVLWQERYICQGIRLEQTFTANVPFVHGFFRKETNPRALHLISARSISV